MEQTQEISAGLSAQNQALMSLLAHGFFIIIIILRKGQVLLSSKP